MSKSKEMIHTMINKIHENADMFYQQNQQEAFQQFSEMLNDISELSTQLFSWKSTGEIVEFDESKYLEVLTQAMNALEVRDDVLLADILNYDLTELLETVEKQL